MRLPGAMSITRQKNGPFKSIEEQLISGASCVLTTRYGLWKSPQVTNDVRGLEGDDCHGVD